MLLKLFAINELQTNIFNNSSMHLHDKFFKIKNLFRSRINFLNKNDLELISLQDILRVHESAYTKLLFGDVDNLIQVISQVFESEKYNHLVNAKNAISIRNKMILESSLVFYAAKECITKGINSFVVGGGMHHATSYFGDGFCLINDISICIKKLQALNIIKTAWIIDVDAHMGNGNSQIFQNDKNVTTLSIHAKNAWPIHQRKIINSDIDIPISPEQNALYLQKLELGLMQLQENYQIPDITFVIQGSDPYEKDSLESSQGLKLSLSQMILRDRLVHCFLNLKMPICYVMAGGYGANSHEPYQEFLNIF